MALSRKVIMAQSKKVIANIKMMVPAGKATPAPPVGSILGQYGVNMMDFINPFNEQTKDIGNFNVPVHVTIFEDKSFKFVAKGPATEDLIKKALNLEKGSGEPNKTKVGKLSKAQVAQIAKQKLPDLNTDNIESAGKVVAGTARSMGIEVEQ
jgi:large subunit ribosomal protein L11